MALNLSGLPEYVKQTSKEFIKDAVMGAQTVGILKNAGSIQFGIKGKAAVNTLSIDVNFQDGSDCGRNPVGSTSIGQAIIEVKPLKDEQNYCPKAYENKWTSEYLTKGQEYSELLFAQEFMTARAEKIAETNEKAIWQGNVSVTGSTNLNKIDGFVKQIKAGAAVNASGSTTGSTIVEKLQGLFLAAPKVTSTSSDARLFIGTDMYQSYVMALANKNIYNPTADKTLFGATIKIEPVDGLIGTGFALVAKPQHLIYGTDMLGEEESATIEYSVETKQIYVDFHWAMGVKPVQTSEMAYSTIA
jgi:hypothetical protein